jgi:conjugal transfer pilus assembly protein TrbC
MSGNVTVSYALDTFAHGNGPGAAIAGQALGRLQAQKGA